LMSKTYLKSDHFNGDGSIEVSQIEKISDDSDARWMEFSEGTPDQIFDSGQLLQA